MIIFVIGVAIVVIYLAWRFCKNRVITHTSPDGNQDLAGEVAKAQLSEDVCTHPPNPSTQRGAEQTRLICTTRTRCDIPTDDDGTPTDDDGTPTDDDGTPTDDDSASCDGNHHFSVTTLGAEFWRRIRCTWTAHHRNPSELCTRRRSYVYSTERVNIDSKSCLHVGCRQRAACAPTHRHPLVPYFMCIHWDVRDTFLICKLIFQ